MSYEGPYLSKILEMYVTDLDLRFPVCKKLILNDIETVQDIISHTEEGLFDILGKMEYVDEIKRKLSVLEVGLKTDTGYEYFGKLKTALERGE